MKNSVYVKDIIEGLGLKTIYDSHRGFEPKFLHQIYLMMKVVKTVGYDIKEIVAKKKDRALATDVLSRGMEKIITKSFIRRKI